jgi:hypothetical protein
MEESAMWQSAMFLICLVAALSGTPLRQAEAASDFARSVGEIGENGIEAPDGGVGDDSDVAIKAEITDLLVSGISVSFPDILPGYVNVTAQPSWLLFKGPAHKPPRSSTRRSRWLAMHQCFLC